MTTANNALRSATKALQSVRALVEDNRRLSEENDKLKMDCITIGCARVSDLLRMDEKQLAVFDSALGGFLDWVLSRPAEVDDLTNRRFSARLRGILEASGITYIDGAADRSCNFDLRSTELSAKQRLHAYVSDRRYWAFESVGASHETALAADTMVKLCEWRGIF